MTAQEKSQILDKLLQETLNEAVGYFEYKLSKLGNTLKSMLRDDPEDTKT